MRKSTYYITTFILIFSITITTIFSSKLLYKILISLEKTHEQVSSHPYLSLKAKTLDIASSPREFNHEKIIYLTIDDGPSQYTNKILETLKEKGVKATFFLLNDHIKNNQQLANHIVADGHSVGCHGVTHQIQYFYSSKEYAVKEMKQCQQTLFQVTRKKSSLIRVPFGSYPFLTTDMKEGLNQAGFIMWDWNIDSHDWSNTYASAILNNISDQLALFKSNEIPRTIILHDNKTTSEILPLLIDLLHKEGYRMAAISEEVPPVQFKLKN